MMRAQKTRKVWAILLIGLAGVLTVPGVGVTEEPDQAGSIGLSVSPGGLLIQHVEPGQMYDLKKQSGVVLTVSNYESQPRTYRRYTYGPKSSKRYRYTARYAAPGR